MLHAVQVTKLGAVFVQVSDLDQSVRFYSEVLKLQLRNIENWEDGRGANYKIGSDGPLLTLLEKVNPQRLQQPAFNLCCENIVEGYEALKSQGVNVGPLNQWSSDQNDHIDFDVFDPDGNAINLIEWKRRA
ncbi:VOC family protein [Paenibacillus turpanensis]|uniref:VOC family protein n=1 Tax=Paenibacillus turpanensis TaxID=2689078 RepID=UPI00140AA1A9